jgi:hypothetical protein
MQAKQQPTFSDAVAPGFLLFFATTSRSAILNEIRPAAGMVPLPSETAQAHLDSLADFAGRLLGVRYLEARRITRLPVGRFALDGLPQGAPAHADIYVLQHNFP